jgi:HemY protein
MIRLLLIIAGLFGLAAGFEWLKDTPGELALTLGGTVYSVGLAEAALALALLAVISVILYLIFRAVVTAPGKAVFAWRGRKVERGRQALSQGLLAIASGDVRGAELAAREAAKRAPDAPLTALLQAQTAQLKGDRDGARDVFTAMLERPETKIAGLHGLFVEAERQGALEAAHHYAQSAREARPDTGWAARALQRYQAAAGDWDGALATLATANDNRSIDKKTARRLRAVLLTAKAMAGEDTDTENAKQAALEAHQLEPELVPAAIIAGRILSRLGELKRGAKVLEASWKVNPHPELAEAHAYLRSGDSALDRMARMDRLFKLKPHNDEGRMALAQMALEAREFDAAREALKPIITTRPTQNALLLMADIDEAEHGDRGRVREWLARAVRAPRDPVWTADGVILDEWAPVSPVTGRIGAVEWKVPVDEGENKLSIDMEDEAFQPRDLLPAASATAAAAAAVAGASEDDTVADEVEEAEIIDVMPQARPDGEDKDAAKAAETEAAEPETVPDAEESVEPIVVAEAEPAAAPEAEPMPEPVEMSEQDKEVLEIIEAVAEPVESAAEEPAMESSGAAISEIGQMSVDTPELETASANGEVPEGGDAAVKTAAANAANDDAPAGDADAAGKAEEVDAQDIVIPHVPDDPGVDEAEEPEPRRFKLF